MEIGFYLKITLSNGESLEREPLVERLPDEYRVSAPRDWFLSGGAERVEFCTKATEVPAGEAGYMFYPTVAGKGFVRTEFCEDRPEAEAASCISATPVGGICRRADSVFFFVTGMISDVSVVAAYHAGTYSLKPVFHLDGEVPDEDLAVRYVLMGEADYSAMARFYRAYQLRERGCVPLSERVRNRPVLREAVESMELRIRMGWKPVPSPVLHQSADNEPELFVACDIKTIDELMDRMAETGIRHAELCLVGWGMGGHDGRFPQQLPSDPRYGTEEEMKALIAKGKRLGYNVSCHVCTTCAYECADNYDEKLLGYRRDEAGKIVPLLRGTYRTTGLSGGLPYSLCAKTSYEHYVRKDFPKIRDYGFRGLFYDDVLTIIEPDRCCHPDHPVSRHEAQEYYKKIARLSKELFGGFQSEGWFDFMAADTDFVMYTTFKTEFKREETPLFDEPVPFFQLVYHGIITSNASSETVNYPIKSGREHLRYLEWGSRPLMYIYSKFGETKNWMGDLDLHTQTGEELGHTVEALKAAYDEYEALKDLQYAFMEQHDRLGEGVYRTTYSDGTVVTVNYQTGEYEIKRGENRK